MKKHIITLILISASLASAQSAQSQEKEQPKTKLEAFAAETGAVIIKGYTDIGKVAGMGAVEVDCREFTNAQSGLKSYGMVINVKEYGRLERENNSFIDFDEIPSLISGIDYISKINKDVTKLQNFEATYTTKGDFAITVFNNAKGEISIAVKSGRIGRASAYLTMQQIDQLRSLIVSAKEKIESIR